MTELILHHYPRRRSRNAERCVLGQRLEWRSVIVPSVMPAKPDVVALIAATGASPFLQIGADIYCDTALICDVLEHLAAFHAVICRTSVGVSRVRSGRHHATTAAMV